MNMNISIAQFNRFLILIFWAFIISSYLSCPADGLNIGGHNNVMCVNHEREALLKFKQGIETDSCGLLSSWGDHSRNCCQWHGIQCSYHTGHVIKLNLCGVSIDHENGCLEGTVGSSLVDLKHLIHLDLSSNYFKSQPIPNFIGSLTKLKYLNLSNAEFGGEIPHQLGNLSLLTYFDLSYNYNLKATSLSWLSLLTLLKYINLSGVDLSEATDWLKFINNLPFLREIHLDECSLPSPFLRPLSYKNSSNTLSFISLSGNDMNNSSIFQWLFNLSGIKTHLAHLDLSWNELGGPLPSGLADSQALSYIDMSHNNLQGNLPFGFENLHALSYLNLGQNKLGGNLPECFTNLKSLSWMDISYNQFEGPIPNTISNNKLLTYLELSSNNFTILPKTLGDLCNLQHLYLSENNLNDELFMIIQSLTGCASKSLLNLDLSGNQIWGSIPDEIDIFSSLTNLILDNNQLNGTISQNIGKLSMLEVLFLSSNNLKGTLSQNHLLNLSKLVDLMLSDNPNLVVNINVDWVPPFQLKFTVLSNCILGPLFPMWIKRQKNISYLDISNAGISDIIPKGFFSTISPQLSNLNISHNNIYGSLPKFPVNFSSGILDIDLSFNNIEGEIPSFPKLLAALKLNSNMFSNPLPFLCPPIKIILANLDLSNNLLSGKLPDCWMNFDRLSILHLDNNCFSGSIPASIGHLKELQALHLHNNSFSGEILRLFENFTSLGILDLGHNSFSGHIPSSIGNNMRSLRILSLRNNKFVGEIPLNLCQMSYLQVLDLSVNHMTGSIPNCISNITAMQNSTYLRLTLEYFFRVTNTTGEFYTDAATIMWKKKEWSFRNSLGLVKEIDLSNNKLEGEIPVGIFNLTGLVSLSLSKNRFNGSISPKIGQLTALEFFDMSNNHLCGEIPTSLTNLNSLEILDLSYNNLSGKIPEGTLLQGFDVSAYAGNFDLCGLPLPKCPWDQPHANNVDTINHQDENGSGDVFPGLYLSVMLGFIIGFWGVCGSLVLNRYWRRTFFQFFEDVKDKLYVKVCVTIARVEKKL